MTCCVLEGLSKITILSVCNSKALGRRGVKKMHVTRIDFGGILSGVNKHSVRANSHLSLCAIVLRVQLVGVVASDLEKAQPV